MALERLRSAPDWDVAALLTTINRDHDRVATHGIRRDVLEAQTRAFALPVLIAGMDWPGSNESYLASWHGALSEARTSLPRLEHCAFGDILLADLRVWREQRMGDAGWHLLFPSWGVDTALLAKQCLEAGHRAHLVCVDTEQLDAAFCGRAFDEALLNSLPDDVDPCGENGEFHTLTHGSPLFEPSLDMVSGPSVLRDDRFRFRELMLRHG